MSLIQTLMRRAVFTTLVCLCIALVLALWRAQVDIDREARGSAQVAQLVANLSAMQRVSTAELPQRLQAVQALNASGSLRHLRLRILDPQGRELVALPANAAMAPLSGPWLHPFSAVPDWRLQWSIPRQEGLPLTGILTANPGSEQDEALSGLLGLLSILFVFAAVLLLGIYLSVQRALRPLHDIVGLIGRIERGDAVLRLPVMSCSELDRIGSALNHLADALAGAQQSRRQLGARIETLQEDERAQIALDLHDEFGQQVTALRANVHWLIRRTEGQTDIQSVLREVEQECERIQHGMRHLLQRLRPHGQGGTETASFANWLQSLIDGWQTRSGNTTQFDLVCDPGDVLLAQQLAVTLYRMTQEALTNVTRHAQAKRASVRVWQEGQALLWQVADDGVGLAEPEQAMLRGRGLAGLRERVWTHGGTLVIRSLPAGGALLQARFELSAQESAA